MLLQAVSRLVRRHAGLVLAIAGQGQLAGDLHEQAKALGLAAHVRLLGARRDVPELLTAADLFVNASHYEGLPLVVLEAMATGTPVVATDVGDVATVLEGAGLVVPPADPASLAMGMEELLADGHTARVLAERGRQDRPRALSPHRMGRTPASRVRHRRWVRPGCCTVTTETPPAGLARVTARGAMWNYATFIVAKGVVLLSTLVLARLLAPEDFGLIALALVVMNALDVINDFGIGSAVIWRADDPPFTSDVAFGLTIGVGVVLTAATLLGAPLVATAFGEPQVAAVIAGLSVTFLIASLGSVQDARLRRALAFRRRFVAELAKAVVKATVTIVLAAAGLGVWALVHGQIAGVATGAACYWALAAWRPRLRFDRTVARSLVSYGGQITLLGLLAVAASNIDYVVIGRRQGTVELGYYALAFRLPGLLILSTCAVLSQVLFPAFTKVSRGHGSLTASLLQTVRALAAVVVPIGVGIALVAPDLVAVLFGELWMPATTVMRWLAAYAVLATLLYSDGDVYKAIGRPVVLNVITIVHVSLAIPVLWWAAGIGIEAVAIGQVVVAAAVLLLRLVLVHRLLGVRPAAVADALRPVFVGAIGLAAAVGATQAMLGRTRSPGPLARVDHHRSTRLRRRSGARGPEVGARSSSCSASVSEPVGRPGPRPLPRCRRSGCSAEAG